jgi:phosphoserine phosphatase RsbU/P
MDRGRAPRVTVLQPVPRQDDGVPVRRNGRRTVAVLIDYLDHLSGGYEGQLRQGFDRASRELDLNLLVVSGRALGDPDPRNQTHNAVYDLLNAQRVDGIVLVAPGLASFSGVDGLTELCRSFGRLPLCSVGSSVPDVPSVVIDQRPGLEAILDHLVLHHRRRRIAFVGGPAKNPDAEIRFQLYKEALARHDLAYDPELVATSMFTIATGAAAIAQIAARGVSFDAVVAGNDASALGVIDYLKSRSIRVPRDVSVTGFDDITVARYAAPPLSTVRQPLKEAAMTAVRLVAEQMGGERVPILTALPVQAVTRASCGCELRNARTAAATVRHAGSAARLDGDRLRALIAAGTRLPEATPQDWPERVVAALQAELDGESDAFLQAIEGLIDHLGRHNELFDELQSIVTLLREELLAQALPGMEDLWHSARRLIAAANTRVQTQQRLAVEMAYFDMLRAGEQLSTALDGATLKQVLGQQLPILRARSAFISLYIAPDHAELAPLFCMLRGQSFESAFASFSSRQLFPPDADLPERTTLFVLPLTFEAEQLGVGVFEFDADVTIHEMLREQISVALKTSALHAEIVHKTALHERSVQERLATAERMQALSVLAGGVAHDLNNALGPLVALPDVILQNLNRPHVNPAEDAELKGDVSTIKLAAQRAAQTIKDLLTLGRQGRMTKEPLDLSAAVVSAMASERLRLPSRGDIRLTLELCSEPLVLHASEPHLVRAISNLLHNAMESIERTGSVTLKTSRVVLTEPLVGYELIAPGDYAVVSVSDTGKGISKADIGRVFEPFFTKKRTSEAYGSGLGLAIVHGVVKEHDGFVNAESKLGKGTTFSLYFRYTGETLAPNDEISLAPGGSARILVVDDDPVQLRTARRVLGALGYDVTTVGRAAKAHELFAAAPAGQSPFDLVILDMLLNEDYDGLQLFERLQELFADQRGILVSGHAPPERERLAVSRGLTWLAKPYSADALAKAVQTAIVADAPGTSLRPSRLAMGR